MISFCASLKTSLAGPDQRVGACSNLEAFRKSGSQAFFDLSEVFGHVLVAYDEICRRLSVDRVVVEVVVARALQNLF